MTPTSAGSPEGGVHRMVGGEQWIIRNRITARTSRDDVGERLGAASQSLQTSSNLRLHLRDPGVKPEALLGGRRLRLAEPSLKATARRTCSVRQRTRIRADLIYEVSQTRDDAESLKETSLSASLASDSEEVRESRCAQVGGGSEGTQPEVEG